MEHTSIGIDISKDMLDIHVHPQGKNWTNKHDTQGIQTTVEQLRSYNSNCIVLEATGGLEMMLAASLTTAGLPVAIVNPRQVRDFARALGRLAKSDAIDAEVLALFAEKVQPACRPIPSEEEQALKDLVTRRRQIVDMRTMESNREQLVHSQQVADSINTVIKTFDRQLKDIDHEIKQRIKASPVWRAKDKLLKSVPGIGDGASAMLMASLPELGTLNRRQIASLVGLAPMNRDSGTFRGRRMIVGGRAAVRSYLYMPTLSAIKHNPKINSFYYRLISTGKTHKVAITACMRKLITILNAVMRENRPWQPINP